MHSISVPHVRARPRHRVAGAAFDRRLLPSVREIRRPDDVQLRPLRDPPTAALARRDEGSRGVGRHQDHHSRRAGRNP